MNVRELAVTGALEFVPPSFPDSRGVFVSPYVEHAFVAAVGFPMPVAQTNHSVSRRGVIRGIHFADVPPGQAKYVYCARGALLDIVVDLRIGSPTFGRYDTVYCDDQQFQAVYAPVGVGHAFIALADHTVIAYLASSEYNPPAEHTINPLDPSLDLPWPEDIEPVLSQRDTQAPSLAEFMASELLPDYADCLAWQRAQRALVRLS